MRIIVSVFSSDINVQSHRKMSFIKFNPTVIRFFFHLHSQDGKGKKILKTCSHWISLSVMTVSKQIDRKLFERVKEILSCGLDLRNHVWKYVMYEMNNAGIKTATLQQLCSSCFLSWLKTIGWKDLCVQGNDTSDPC